MVDAHYNFVVAGVDKLSALQIAVDIGDLLFEKYNTDIYIDPSFSE